MVSVVSVVCACGPSNGMKTVCPLDPLFGAPLFQKQADVGVGRGPGGPPYCAYL
jgi:hypothetical protein